MVTLSDISIFLNDSILNEWFFERENQIATLTEEDKENIKDLLQAKKHDYSKILIAIDNVPNAFVETRKLIKDSVNTYSKTLNCIEGYQNEKYYKCGFCDGAKLILEVLENKKENSKS